MKTLYIIGNGFDSHHRLETNYLEFRTWLEENDWSVLQTIDELFGECDNEWWSKFEESLATAITSEIVYDEVIENYPDFASDDFRDSDWYDAEYAVENRISDAYEAIRAAFHKWIATLSLSGIKKKLRIQKENALFLSFNYTTTLESVYGISREQILYIHGKAGTDDELVLGHGVSIETISRMIDLSCFINGEDSCGFIEQRAIEAAIKGVWNQRKKVDNIIEKYNCWFSSITDVTNICIYGHSFGEVDIPYFRKIFSTANSNAMIEVSAFTTDDRINIENFMRSENIKKDRYKVISLNDINIDENE